MFEQFNNLSFKEWVNILLDVFFYWCRKWYLLVLAAVFSGAIGYLYKPAVKESYTATFSFVLSTETKSSGVSGIASQFGLEVGTGGSENIFSGDNIIELFKSRKMVSYSLMHKIDNSDVNLLTYITKKLYSAAAKEVLPYPDNVDQFTVKQKAIFEKIASMVTGSFSVFKKDKKLIFYLISATSPYDDIAYYVARHMLDQTSQFFIETKTKVATRSLELLQKEADSLSNLLGKMFQSTAAMNDRSFNINPSILSQRAGAQLYQAKSSALAAAYTEVMRNLEIAKINIQKETPLFQVIDEPVLPLAVQRTNVSAYVYYAAYVGLLLMIVFLTIERLWTTKLKFSK